MDGILHRVDARFYQVAYVVRNLNAAQKFFQRMIGIERFTSFEVELGSDQLRLRGKPAGLRVATALGYLGDIQFELIQPLSANNIFTEFLEQSGPGLHHIAFVVADLNEAKEAARALGLEPSCDGRVESGLTLAFAYYQCEYAEASAVELLEMDDRCRKFMERIRSPQKKE